MSKPPSPDTSIRPTGPSPPSNHHEIRTSQPQTIQPQPQRCQTPVQTRPQLQAPGPGVPTPVRPGEYLVLLTPNPRQPGVQGLRYPFLPIQRHPIMTTPGATILQRPALIRGVSQPTFGVHPTVIPTSQPFGMAGLPASMASVQGPSIIHQGANFMNTCVAPSQMPPQDSSLTKGTNFLISLLTRMKEESKLTLIQTLIQSLIDGRKSPEEFAVAIQEVLDSGPHGQLAPFLANMLPQLRQSMTAGHTILPGIRPPNMQTQMSMNQQSSDHVQQQTMPSTSSITDVNPINNAIRTNNIVSAPLSAAVSSPMPPQTPIRIPAPTATSVPSTSAPPPAKKKKVPLAPGEKSAYAIKKEAREARKRERELAAQNVKVEKVDLPNDTEHKIFKSPPKVKSDKPKQSKQKKTEKQLESLSATLRDDDDVNDVAAMGGVNLAEESQKIMAAGAELVGTQIRSCKDEPFFDLTILSTKISRIVKENNLPEPSNDVVTLISHAVQEKLKDIVERLGVLAEHRAENLRLNPIYEVSNDRKGQMKFLAELDRIEKRRYEEQERELLLKVAKSRSKVEDPEQQKLRQKAKDMQRAEQEEVRQREANQTALLAIGPRKKLKTDSASSLSSFSQSSAFKDTKPGDIRSDSVKRIKRVNMRDLQVLLELDRIYLDRLIRSFC